MQYGEQPAPVANDRVPVWPMVQNDVRTRGLAAPIVRGLVTDMENRDAFGAKKYGTRLQPFNGRSFVQDAYEEALDASVYLRGAIMEAEADGHEADDVARLWAAYNLQLTILVDLHIFARRL